jgi:hypothetical protein
LLLLTALSLLVLLLNVLLLRLDFSALHRQTTMTAPPPFLTAAPEIVASGQRVHLHLEHFPAFAQIYFSRDVGQALAPAGGTSLVRLGQSGSADLSISIGPDWNPGSHTIQAEDVSSHYTASTTVQVLAGAPLRPPALRVERDNLDMGAALQEINSALPLMLHNDGDGAISWSASSDQPWLLTTPTQGVLGDRQTILVAVSRVNLPAGSYRGTLTFTSDSGPPVHVTVAMRVLSPGAAAAPLELTPAALSFAMSDGGPEPATQFIMLTNPASRPVSWSGLTLTPAQQDGAAGPLSADAGWLHISQLRGTLAAGRQVSLEVTASGAHLLPGVYLAELRLSQDEAKNSPPQLLAVSLTVTPSCRLTMSMQNLAFSAISGHSEVNSQAIDLGVAPGCATINWQTFTSASWLQVHPASGSVASAREQRVLVSVAVDQLNVGSYSGFVLFSLPQRTQTVAVQLNVLAAAVPPSGESGVDTGAGANSGQPGSSLGVQLTPTNLSFSAQQKGSPPAPGYISLTATQQALTWSVALNSASNPWLQVTPEAGTLLPGQTARLTVSIQTAGLAPGSYTAQFAVLISPANAGQGRQISETVTVTLTVQAGCVLQVTPSSLLFRSSLLQPDPPPQSITVHVDGGCSLPISWNATVDAGSSSWLHLIQSSGSDDGTGSMITVYVTAPRLLLKTLSGQISVTAVDKQQNPLQNSPQVVTVLVSPG